MMALLLFVYTIIAYCFLAYQSDVFGAGGKPKELITFFILEHSEVLCL